MVIMKKLKIMISQTIVVTEKRALSRFSHMKKMRNR